MKKYTSKEIYTSIQGEGRRIGTLNIFVRFSYCNLRCNVEENQFACDTDFTGGEKYDLHALLMLIRATGGACKNIIFTGGEPMLQVDTELCEALKGEGYYLAVETNGTVESDVYPYLDWITVSPKTAEHTLRASKCHELKYVLADGAHPPVPSLTADNYLLSPVFDGMEIDRTSLRWCVKQIKDAVKIPWELSVQNHKFWKVR